MNISKLFKLKMFWGLFLFCLQVNAQISTGEEPISFKTNIPTLRVSENTQKTLPLLDMLEIAREDTEDEFNGIPPRFGFPHEVHYDLENSGEWTKL